MMAIEMSGGVYCPLSPRDPKHRLHELVQQTQSPVVLIHFLTRTKISENIISIDTGSLFTDYNVEIDVDLDHFQMFKSHLII